MVNAIPPSGPNGTRRPSWSSTSLWPREHGAYGQVIFPIVTAVTVTGVSVGGTLLAIAVVAGFLAHEPAMLLLGHRGPRAKREQGRAAHRWLAACVGAGVSATVLAIRWLPARAVWSLAVPAVPALALAIAMLRNREKTWYGETAAALAFSGVAVPMMLATGAPVARAVAVALPFALLFVTTTLAVRVVILRVRGGGDPAASAATRRATLMLAVCSTMLLALATSRAIVAPSLLVSAMPGLLGASVLAWRPPSPTQLRRVGWTLVSLSLLTCVLVVATA